MADIAKRGLLTAIGAASFAAQKAEKILRGAANKGLISTKDSKALLKRLAKEAENGRRRVQKIISSELKRVEKVQKKAEKRGKEIVKKAAKRL